MWLNQGQPNDKGHQGFKSFVITLFWVTAYDSPSNASRPLAPVYAHPPKAVVHGGDVGPASDCNTPSVLPSLWGTGKKAVLPLETPPCSQILRNIIAKFHISSTAEVCKHHDVQKMGTSFFPLFCTPTVWLAPPQESMDHLRITLKWAPWKRTWGGCWNIATGCPDWWWMSHPWKHERLHWTKLWAT